MPIMSHDTEINETPFRKVSVLPRRLSLTEFFVKRRSNCSRHHLRTAITKNDFITKIKNGVQDGLQLIKLEGKGRGVMTRIFNENEFVVEYAGELLTGKEARAREVQFAKNEKLGCYLYYFQHHGSSYCVDATAETIQFGRLINHSKNGNLVTKVVDIEGVPKLIFFAKRHINIGEELCYDYGDRRRETIKHHGWLLS